MIYGGTKKLLSGFLFLISSLEKIHMPKIIFSKPTFVVYNYTNINLLMGTPGQNIKINTGFKKHRIYRCSIYDSEMTLGILSR